MHSMRENERHNTSCHKKITQQKNMLLFYCVFLLPHSSTCKNQHDKYPPLNVALRITYDFDRVKKFTLRRFPSFVFRVSSGHAVIDLVARVRCWKITTTVIFQHFSSIIFSRISVGFDFVLIFLLPLL